MPTLHYRSFVDVGDLKLGECTVHRAVDGTGQRRYWNLWFYVARETDGVAEAFCVPVNPGGTYSEVAGWKTWGLTKTGEGVWQVSPSINVLGTREPHPGEHPSAGSLWHQTPSIDGVPDADTWTTGAPA